VKMTDFVYAIAFVGNRFVMVRHKARAWEMPGGRIAKEERPIDAIIREFDEETGMSFEPISSIRVEGGEVFFGVASGEPLLESEEISEVAFFDELPHELSFQKVEYEKMLQEAVMALKKYINGEPIGGISPTWRSERY